MSYRETIEKDLLDQNAIKANLKSRKSKYFFKSIKKSELQSYTEKGWEIQRENKNSFRIQTLKPLDVWFEDRVWCLFAKMGFNYMNADRKFRLNYAIDNSIPGKQIDIFAVDDETIFVIECKSAQKRKSLSFQKDINEINGIRGKIDPNLQKCFTGKQKIAWLFCTENIILSDHDKARLKEHRIFYLNHDDISYYEQLIDQLGKSAKYQLYARFFANQQIPELKNRVPAIQGEMGGYTYYSFSIEPDTLLKVSYILHRMNTSDESLSTYQRMVKKNRIKQINEFLNGDNNFFPNSIIINIDTKKGKPLNFIRSNASDHDSSTKIGVLHLPKCYKSAFIIDGQHRLYGYGENKYRFSHLIQYLSWLLRTYPQISKLIYS